MLLPSKLVLESLAAECSRTSGGSDAQLMGSSQQAITLALQLLHRRETGQVEPVRHQIDRLFSAAEQCLGLAGPACEREMALLKQHASISNSLPELEQLQRSLVRIVEQAVSSRKAASSKGDWASLAHALASWEIPDLREQLASAATNEVIDTTIDALKLTAYLQDRFDDSSLFVNDFRALMGGFGKQTFLFSVQGRSLAGEYVIRRDANQPFVDNDCHRIDIEFQMIRAARAHGFPAPEALWVDTQHALLPGGHFLVMRRAAGKPGGDVFGANGRVPAQLADTLARILAHLHSLPALGELATLNESTNQSLRDAPLEYCVRHYLERWRSLFLNSEHLPSPTILAQFGWLLDNLPELSGHPVLLHGDIGFHNFLFDGDELTAVLDWEFAHLGDPAEDLAYVRNTLADALDWPAFISAYRQAGGREIDKRRLHFFQVWGHLRNACAGNLAAAAFVSGAVSDLKMVLLPHTHVPAFLGAAQALIDQSTAAQA